LYVTKKTWKDFFLVGSRIAEQLMQESWSKFFYTLGEHCTIPPPPPDRDEQRPQLLPAAQATPFQQTGMSSAPPLARTGLWGEGGATGLRHTCVTLVWGS